MLWFWLTLTTFSMLFSHVNLQANNCEEIIEWASLYQYTVQDCDSADNHSFYRIDGTSSSAGYLTWNQANLACQRLGGNLASIRNFAEFRLVKDLTSNLKQAAGYAAWIGLNDKAEERIWEWSDQGDVATYFQWLIVESSGPGPPALHLSSRSKNCVSFTSRATQFRNDGVYIVSHGYLNEECENGRHAICKN